MNKTIFQKIIDREIPAEIVYEDDNYIAILDIFPKSKGHTLVISKEPYRWVNDVPNFGEYFEIAKKVALAIEKALAATYISYQTYGVEVPHAHIHIVPRYNLSEERLERTKPTNEELKEIGEMIRKELE
jgi:histidine triad (HIT) family protein